MDNYSFDIFDKEGNPITVGEWGRLKRDREYSVIGSDDVGDYWISTVWLGLDHGFDGVLKLFETMVFKRGEDGEVNYSDLYCDRYTTEQEAKEGHKRVVATYKDLKSLEALPEVSKKK